MRRTVMWSVVLCVSLMFISACDVVESFGDRLLRQSSATLVTRVILRVDASPETFTAEQVRQSADILRNRLFNLGVTLPEVLVGEAGTIEVLLPAVPDVGEVIKALTESAVLELVDFTGLSAFAVEYSGRPILTAYQVENSILNAQGVGTDSALMHPETGAPFITILNQEGLSSATAQLDTATQNWMIAFELTPDAGEIFAAYTAAHIGEPLAIVLNGVILTVPHIQAQITTGGVISGNFSELEAKRLAAQLNAGALKLPLIVESIESIEP